MYTHFKSAMDKITADNELIKKTENYLKNTIGNAQKNTVSIKSPHTSKRLIAACIAILFVLGSFIGGYKFIKTPIAYISLDINPSIELGINAFGKIVIAEGVNQDGQVLMEGQDIINCNLTEAIDKLLTAAADHNYIADDGTTVIAITAESNNTSEAEKLQSISEEAVNSAIKNRNISAIIYKNCSDLSLREEAKELGISPGKYKLIKSLQELDPNITVEQLKDAKVSDIIKQSKDLINSLQESEEQIDDTKKTVIENLKKVAQEVDKRTRDFAKDKAETIRSQAKAEFEAAKAQAQNIQNEAKQKAEQLRNQAKSKLQNIEELPEDERAKLQAQAQELLNQADSIIQEANKQAETIRENAEKQKQDAMLKAEKIKQNSEQENSSSQSENLSDEKNKNSEAEQPEQSNDPPADKKDDSKTNNQNSSKNEEKANRKEKSVIDKPNNTENRANKK